MCFDSATYYYTWQHTFSMSITGTITTLETSPNPRPPKRTPFRSSFSPAILPPHIPSNTPVPTSSLASIPTTLATLNLPCRSNPVPRSRRPSSFECKKSAIGVASTGVQGAPFSSWMGFVSDVAHPDEEETGILIFVFPREQHPWLAIYLHLVFTRECHPAPRLSVPDQP
ncbi:hypothetical protein CVT26_003682 [Gymnopilus dilepis]|uniref:Uncharacterized protein n=1 Tax=Gymnopilus dilepis TaxID=231916 RepID=A0A409WUA7_9AGAR|nr:hypothetical protein CVT26_003682 [Gymnopilus dilepis]